MVIYDEIGNLLVPFGAKNKLKCQSILLLFIIKTLAKKERRAKRTTDSKYRFGVNIYVMKDERFIWILIDNKKPKSINKIFIIGIYLFRRCTERKFKKIFNDIIIITCIVLGTNKQGFPSNANFKWVFCKAKRSIVLNIL